MAETMTMDEAITRFFLLTVETSRILYTVLDTFGTIVTSATPIKHTVNITKDSLITKEEIYAGFSTDNDEDKEKVMVKVLGVWAQMRTSAEMCLDGTKYGGKPIIGDIYMNFETMDLSWKTLTCDKETYDGITKYAIKQSLKK